MLLPIFRTVRFFRTEIAKFLPPTLMVANIQILISLFNERGSLKFQALVSISLSTWAPDIRMMLCREYYSPWWPDVSKAITI